MKIIKNLHTKKGVLLIICLILVVVLASIALSVTSTVVVDNKASKYSAIKMEAQQKAD